MSKPDSQTAVCGEKKNHLLKKNCTSYFWPAKAKMAFILFPTSVLSSETILHLIIQYENAPVPDRIKW